MSSIFRRLFMARKSVLLITIALLIAFVPAVYGESVPPELTCGEAPFGSPVGKVLKTYKGSEIVQEATPYIESIGNYVLEKHFKGGLQRDDSGICFLPNIVKKYSISHGGWKNCSAMTLYFGAFKENAKDYELFMVKKTQATPSPDADFKKVFDKLAVKLDKEMGTGHTVDQGRIQSFAGAQSHTFYLPALVGTWSAKDTLAFLMVANSPEEGPLPPEVVYVSKPALKRYLEVCKTY
jgi:hypothetical protein